MVIRRTMVAASLSVKMAMAEPVLQSIVLKKACARG
jgi:hypothetical protein